MDNNSNPIPGPAPSPPAAGPKEQIIDRLKTAANVLVTVSSNPSVDQLSGAIGLTLLLNKMGKHGTAVFSGKVPSTIQFLQPEKTLETNTDSLRDFIIALDKSKADKLRYKVEGDHVKIFITPYRTSISEKDLEFSQGDFNVDVVVALGVKEQKELDQAITAHGRILHDATLAALSTAPGANLGSMNWIEPKASSLSEMLVTMAEQLAPDGFDAQIATAFLTGIVAETARFSNEKTSPQTMSVSSELMAAGANQQLIANELQPKPPPPPVQPKPDQPPSGNAPAATPAPKPAPPKPSDGSLLISHDEEQPEPPTEEPEQQLEQIHIDEDGQLHPLAEEQSSIPVLPPVAAAPGPSSAPTNSFMVEPPTLGGTLTANSRPEDLSPMPTTDPLSLPPVNTPLLSHDAPLSTPPALPAAEPSELPRETDAASDTSSKPLAGPDQAGQTLTQLEEAVGSPHVQDAAGNNPLAGLDDARDAVSAAINADPNQPLPPPAALGSQPLDLDVQAHDSAQTAPAGASDPLGLPPNLIPPAPSRPVDLTGSPTPDPAAPPPVPPPMMPPPPPTDPVSGQVFPPDDQNTPPINPPVL